jgi:hypothetical protein
MMRDYSAKCSDLTPGILMKKKKVFGVRMTHSLVLVEKVKIKEEDKKLVSFCETLDLLTLNGSREGKVAGEMTLISQACASVIDFINKFTERVK